MRDLEKALRGMTRTAQERFLEAFEAINRNFQDLFTRLFEGGRAELRLVEAPEGGDPLETGIEMVAQPRGKRLQAISLLSGGEKALTGLALLFAIFYYRPSPFCLLDEVDAPARRREHPPVHAGPPGAVEPDPVHRDHPQPEDHGGGRRAVRRHHGGAGSLPDRLRQPRLRCPGFSRIVSVPFLSLWPPGVPLR